MLCMHRACLKLRRTEFEEPSVLSSTVSIFALCSGGTHYFSSLVALRPREMAEIVSGLGCAFLAYQASCVHTREIYEAMSPKRQDHGHQP